MTALGGKSSTLELATWRPDGTPAVVIVTAIPSANKRKEVLFYGHDISSRHTAQKVRALQAKYRAVMGVTATLRPATEARADSGTGFP